MYHRLLQVNLHSAFDTLREATRHMRQRAQAGDPGGSLVACGSLSMFHGLQGMEHDAAAKGALSAMITGLAVEMGPYGVRANKHAPGFIMTGMIAQHFVNANKNYKPGDEDLSPQPPMFSYCPLGNIPVRVILSSTLPSLT